MLARIELGGLEMALLQENQLTGPIVRYLKALGYKYVTLDMEGYRSGSMNALLNESEREDER